MSSATTVRLILMREVVDRLRNRLYVVGTLVITVAVAAVVGLPGLLGDGAPERYRLGVVGAVPESFYDRLADAAGAQGAEVATEELADRTAATAAVTEGEVDAALLDASELMAEGAPDAALHAAVETALDQAAAAAQLEAAGLAEEELAALVAPRDRLVIVDPEGAPEGDTFAGWIVGFAATVLLFASVTANASSLLTGAVEEKSSRVVEVLLGSVRPWQLLAGKIIAMTVLALAQLALVAGAALGANAVAGTVELPAATGAVVATSLLMLVIGFVFYAALYTVAGSLASTAEDAQGSAGPLGFLVMGAYFAVIFAVLPNPTGVWAQVLTYLPPTAPFTVPARVAAGAISGWEVALATLVTLAGVVATVALAARLYASSLLAGGKLTWRQAWRTEPVR